MANEVTNYESRHAELQARLSRKWAARFKAHQAKCDPSDPVCTTCLKEYAENHRARTEWGPSLPTDCKLSTLQNLQADMAAPWWDDLTPEEQASYKVAKDPVYWAAARLRSLRDPDTPWTPEWYQIEPLRCLPGDQVVYMADGTVKRMDEIVVGDLVIGYDERNRKTCAYPVTAVFDQGIRNVYRITLRNGDTLKCTSDHEILAHFKCGKLNDLHGCPAYKTVYRSIDDGLTVGNKVYTLNSFAAFGSVDDVDLAKVLGYLVTDGWVRPSRHGVFFANTNQAYVEEYAECVNRLFPDKPAVVRCISSERIGTDGCPRRPVYQVAIRSKDGSFLKFLRSIGCTDKENKELSILNFAFKFNREALGHFVNRCWAGDGSVYKGRSTSSLRLSSGNIEFLHKYRYLLKKFGVNSRLYKDKKDPTARGRSLSIQRSMDILAFFEAVGLVFGKETRSTSVIEWARAARKPGLGMRKGRFRTSARVPIRKIEYVGKERVHDIEVARRRNFIAQGVIVHNCTSPRLLMLYSRQVGKTEVICVRILNHMDTRKNYKIVVVCPYQKQINEIYTRLLNLIRCSPDLFPRMTRCRENPNEIQFDNGSYVRLFTAGVQTGKGADDVRGQPADCFIEGTLVNTSEFAVRPIEKMTLECSVLGGDHSGVVVSSVDCLLRRPKRETLSVSTWLTSAICTPEHPLFNGTRDVPTKDATHVVVSLAHQDLCFSYRMIKARLAGYNFGDGWLTSANRHAGFAGQRGDLEQIVEDLTLLGDHRHQITTTYKENPDMGIAGWVSEFNSTLAYDTLKDSCPIGYKTEQKLSVPDWIRNGHRYTKASFLSGLFSAESTPVRYQGPARRTVRTIDISMVSVKEGWIRSWMEQVRSLLTDLGIRTSEVKTWPKKDNGKWYGGFTVCNAKENIDAFVDRVGFCYSVAKRISANVWRMYRRYEKVYDLPSWRKNRAVRGVDGPSSRVVEVLGVPLSTAKYHRRLYSWLYSEKKRLPEEVADHFRWKDHYVVLPIQPNHRVPCGTRDVYNMQTNAKHRYFAGGMFTHNCLAIDEMDLLDDKTIVAILPTLRMSANPETLVSSTPTGKRGKFFEWATDPTQMFRVLHVESREAPGWKEEDELFLRKTYPRAFYMHEFEARFGEMEAGVFRKQYLEDPNTLRAYDISNSTPAPSDDIYCMGVDWNSKGVGGVFVVVGYGVNPKKTEEYHRFRLVHREIVDPEDFTQLNSVLATVNLARIWKPKYIYVDSGFGGAQIELLRKHGLNNPETKMHRIVRGIPMNSNIEIRDPLTKKMVKRQAKNLLVELCVARLEQGQIVLPKSEDHRHGLVGQMREYEVERIGRSNKKVYTGEHDHLIIAWVLAVGGLILEDSDIRRAEQAGDIVLLDLNLKRVLKQAVKDKAKKSPRKNRLALEPKSRSAGLTVDETLRYAQRSLPNSIKRRVASGNHVPMGRSRW